ncbi:MAG: bifunctional UDP-N-acetylmuramoyl-tripeptide:D-alanyl-D-alanine ligase/alanine racemase [Bacteroidota bacterium]
MNSEDYSIQDIAKIVGGKLYLNDAIHPVITELLIDSRNVIKPETSLFFALIGRQDGHNFIESLIAKGVNNFIISSYKEAYKSLSANFILVNDTLNALQELAVFHRSQFNLPVVGITGSNGKTIIKEWLYQLLRVDKNIVRSPKSYNSQIGVPLSVWLINKEHNLGVFEAGISLVGEMEKLQRIIRPSIGIFTNIGEAHSENFVNLEQKTREKMKLFRDVELLIYCKDHPTISHEIGNQDYLSSEIKFFSWSRKTRADLQISRITKGNGETTIQGIYENDFKEIKIPFSDEASIENAIHCWALLLHLKYEDETISERMEMLSPVAMRLEMKEGINNCSIINDSYNSDLGSLTIALDFLNQQNQHDKRTLIISDILQSGRNEQNLYEKVASLVKSKRITRIIGIGEAISKYENLFEIKRHFYKNTEEFLRDYTPLHFNNETILLKGARAFGFERISKLLQQKNHETILEINLNAIAHNLNYYRSRINPETKIMAMVKAFSYGSGSFEIANVLQFQHIDYLAVAYTDEGVELRKRGIDIPIMVMNPDIQSFDAMIDYYLEPEIYSFNLLNHFAEAIRQKAQFETISPFPIHIEFDTGMKRLGFEEDDLNELIIKLLNNKLVRVQSIFSHLVGSEDPIHDTFSMLQIEQFTRISTAFKKHFNYPIMSHILNSSGITRFADSHMDMVRLGLGLYGISPNESEQKMLANVGTLKTVISQIRTVYAGDTIGYSRRGIAKKDIQLATVAIGYADGYSRRFGNGQGKMLVNGQIVPTVGNICMDMCMLDISDVSAKEGDEVLVFGTDYPVSQSAKDSGTIPYEILTNISQRVKRIYYQE